MYLSMIERLIGGLIPNLIDPFSTSPAIVRTGDTGMEYLGTDLYRAVQIVEMISLIVWN